MSAGCGTVDYYTTCQPDGPGRLQRNLHCDRYGHTALKLPMGFNGTNIAGATGTSLALSNVQTTQAGIYAVGVATLTVQRSAPTES